MGILKIKLLKGTNLDVKYGNIFCKFQIGTEKDKTRRKKSANPVWDELFCARKVNPATDQLMIQVFDRSLFGKTEKIGWCVLPLHGVLKTVERSFDVLLQGAASGTLTVVLTGVDFGSENAPREQSVVTCYTNPQESDPSVTTFPNEIGNEWYMPPAVVEVKEEALLGKGAFGVVYQGTIFGKAVAIKKLNKQDISEEALEEFTKEVKVMCRIRHPNVVLFMGACTDLGHLAIVTELLPKGSLESLLKNNALSFFQKFAMAKDIALALNWLHCSQGILHLDLKPANLLVDENWNVKLADFGLASLKNNIQSGQMVGTPWFMAPEILLQKRYDEKADVYSYGIVLWQMYTNDLKPYGDRIKSLNQLTDAVAFRNERPRIPNDCPKELVETMTLCWTGSAFDRPSFQFLIGNNLIDNIVLSRFFGPDQELGRECWCRLCFEKVIPSVSWNEFLNAFKQTIKVPTITLLQEKCLQKLLQNGAQEVTCEKFSQVLEWIGPLVEGEQVLNRVERLLSRPDFFGLLSGREAEQKLVNQKVGTYILRFSSNTAGDYAITALDENKAINHYKIQKVYRDDIGGRRIAFSVGTEVYDNIESVISNPPPQLGQILKHCCPGSPFSDLFRVDYNGPVYVILENLR